MAGKSEISQERPSRQFVETTEQPASVQQDGGASRRSRFLLSFRPRGMVPSRPDAGLDTSNKTGSPAEHAALIPSHRQENDTEHAQDGNNSRSPAGQSTYLVRQAWGTGAVFVPNGEKNEQSIDGSLDGTVIDASGTVDLSSHFGIYTASVASRNRSKPVNPDQITTELSGDGDDGPPDGMDRISESDDPDNPLNQAKKQLSERLQERGIYPGTFSFRTIQQWANHETYSSLKAKMTKEQKEEPNEELVGLIETLFQDSLRNIHTLAKAHPREYEDATNLFGELLPHYEEALLETDPSFSSMDLRIRAAGQMGMHMDAIEQESFVAPEELKQTAKPEPQEATENPYAQVKERLTRLVLATDPNSPKLAFLHKYTRYVMNSKMTRLNKLAGRLNNEIRAQRELVEIFDSESWYDKRKLGAFSVDDIIMFYEQGILPLYKEALIQELGLPNYRSGRIIQEAEFDVETAAQIFTDLEEIMNQNRPEERKDDNEHQFAYAQEKLMGGFLAGDWVETPLLAEVLSLQVRQSQAESLWYKARIACAQNKISGQEAGEAYKRGNAQRTRIHSNFISEGWKWMRQHDTHPYDFYAALWQIEEVYQDYIDAARNAQSSAEVNLTTEAQAGRLGAYVFRRDVTPLLLSKDILDLSRGNIRGVFHRHRMSSIRYFNR